MKKEIKEKIIEAKWGTKNCPCACHPIRNGKPVTFIHCRQCANGAKGSNLKP